MDFDSTKISYEKLLSVFWDSHNPFDRPWSKQYMSLLFFHNEEQRRLAIETRDREAAKGKNKILTEIIPAGKFYLAESYHQKYYLRRESDIMRELKAMYPDDNDFINSTAAARINGYLGGYGALETLQAELDTYGLSPAGSKKLLNLLKHRGFSPGCRLEGAFAN
jgi:peptide-methionine (S)-S-oxide reductase